MKFYKNLFFIIANITIVSNYSIQAGNAFSSPRSHYTSHLHKFKQQLFGIPQSDINIIMDNAKKTLKKAKPKTNSHINQLMRGEIITHLETIAQAIAQQYTADQTIIDNSVSSMVGNIMTYLEQNKNIDGSKLEYFFNRNQIKRLITQNIKQSILKDPSPEVIYSPDPPYAHIIPSAPPAPQEEECFHCFNDYAISDLFPIPCPFGEKHSERICTYCIPNLGSYCPVCRRPLYK